MTDEVKVRIATPDDLHQVMELAMMANEEIGIAPANAEKLLHDVWPALHLQNGIVGVIGKPGGRLEGGTMLTVQPLWYMDEPMIEERVVFVRPEYRQSKGGRGRKLCEFARNVSDKLHMPLVIGIATKIDLEPKMRMYERIFGQKAGAYFVYGLEYRSEAARAHTQRVMPVAAE